MSPTQLQALQRYVSAVAYFMTHSGTRDDTTRELLASRKHMETSFGCELPTQQPQRPAFPDIL